ncbi:MAG: Na+/H+ antiporter NhaA [Flavobacteriales bacterium]|jgi:NhaA family Na+:H+ antiporter|nr:Na+/H+ antiporter NhaA [Flavobacteriales bacterium]
MRKDPIDRLLKPVDSFIHDQAASGLVLFISTAIALFLANSPWRDDYHQFWTTLVGIKVGDFILEKDLLHLINDGLMAMFFFVVALELKREFVGGEFSKPRNALLPIGASIGGMAFPALIFLFIVGSSSPESVGWGIPMGTDTAFVLGLLAILGSRVPAAIKVFFISTAVTDDIGAVSVIALFYTSDISMVNLLLGGVFLVALIVMNLLGVRSVLAYGVVGIGGLWMAFLLSGVHATVAGVLAALCIPARTKMNEASYPARLHELADKFSAMPNAPGDTISSEQQHLIQKVKRFSTYAETPLQRLEQGLHPWVAFGVLPLFALANAGIELPTSFAGVLDSKVTLGIFLGLVIGKPLGLMFMSWLFVRLRLGQLAAGVSWMQMLAVCILSGLGFTMAVFINELAFADAATREDAKLGILFASVVAGGVGFALFRSFPKRKPGVPAP